MTTATSTTRPTAPLPSAAAAALSRLESSPVAPRIVMAVTQYTTAALHAAALATQAVSPEEPPLSDLDADSLAHAEDLMAGARAVLAEAGQLALIGGA